MSVDVSLATVQSQDTNQAMQQEREVWQRETAALHAELEQLHRERPSQHQDAPTSPSEQQATKSPSPTLNAEETILEISMSKVREGRAIIMPHPPQ